MTRLPPLSGPVLALDGAAHGLAATTDPLLVRAGALNLFAEQAGGRRSFLFQCGPGELVFGLPGMAGWRLVALGTLGTEVMQVTAGAVDALPAPQRAALLAGWLARIGVADQVTVTGQLGPLHQEAAARFARALEQEQEQRAALLARSWRHSAGEYAAALGALAQVVRDGGGTAPDDAQAPPCPAAPALPARPRAAPVPPQPQGGPALRACRRVASAMGIDFTLPPDVPDDTPLDELLALAGIRRRSVLLRGPWWTDDNGPLVGFDAARQPLALLPVRGGYRVLDASGAARRVDAGVAASLAPDALMLYRPLRAARLDGMALLRFSARGLSGDLMTMLLVGLAASMLGLLMPLATAWLVGAVIPQGALDQHLQLVGLLIAGTLGAAGFELCKAFLLLRCEARIDLALQSALFDRLLRLPVRFFRRFAVADLADRALGVQEIRTILAGTVPGALLGGVFSVTSLAAMFHYGPGLALAGLAPVALVVALTMHVGRRQLRHQAEQVRLRGTVEALVLQFVLGVGKLRAAAAEPRALAAWARRYREQARRAAFARRGLMVQELVQACAPPLASLLVFALVWQALRSGAALAPAQVLAFLAAYGQLLAALTGVTLALTRALEVVPLWRRLRPLLDETPENTAGHQAPARLTGAIDLHEVSFHYDADGPPILDSVSLSIQAGQFVAIVGPSGSGKSTLLRLMMGFEAPASGTVAFDGVPLEELDAAALRRRIGVVLQAARISAGSVFDNIAAGQRISHAEALEAARQVGFAHEIEAMPMGLHTVLQEGGGTLSGGQRQRLLLARALARKPAFLLLDEATSALDNRTQATLMDSLSQLALTRVMVAHRLSTVVAADQIVVVEAGRVVQRGTYTELMSQPGLFAELARRQLL